MSGRGVCAICARPLPARRWWQVLTGPPLCPPRDVEACRAAFETRLAGMHWGEPP